MRGSQAEDAKVRANVEEKHIVRAAGEETAKFIGLVWIVQLCLMDNFVKVRVARDGPAGSDL
jgi:hypothetical protein